MEIHHIKGKMDSKKIIDALHKGVVTVVFKKLDTGEIRIGKETEDSASYSIGDGEYDTIDGIIRKEEVTYTPKETIIGKDGKPVEVKDTYDEATMKPDEDGGEGDFETVLESIDEILELLSKDGKTYSKEELLKQLQLKTISCKDVTFRIFGFSLTTINIMISLFLVIMSIKVYKNYEKLKKKS